MDCLQCSQCMAPQNWPSVFFHLQDIRSGIRVHSTLRSGSPRWCRYSMFYVLYPSGIVSEVALIILALPEMKVRCHAQENMRLMSKLDRSEFLKLKSYGGPAELSSTLHPNQHPSDPTAIGRLPTCQGPGNSYGTECQSFPHNLQRSSQSRCVSQSELICVKSPRYLCVLPCQRPNHAVHHVLRNTSCSGIPSRINHKPE